MLDTTGLAVSAGSTMDRFNVPVPHATATAVTTAVAPSPTAPSRRRVRARCAYDSTCSPSSPSGVS
ncbi:Uncharacterised protein [Mycobacteroides abscessus subsp. abscessus]|nr:Uncharacterised protein [Mycobacteroides abscessus subsp. abscessus]